MEQICTEDVQIWY